MFFNSIEFAIFFPTVFLLYWLVFKRFGINVSNIFLIFISYIFYGWWNWKVVFLLFSITSVSYFIGLAIKYFQIKDAKKNNKWYNNRAFIANLSAIIINIGLLAFFKYYGFFSSTLSSILTIFGKEISIKSLDIILPIGISFYTFQSLTYTIDIYYKKISPTKDLISFYTFMSFYPPLMSGPIGRASQLIEQFQNNNKFDYDLAILGCKQLLWGLFMKLCIADRLSLYVDTVYGNLQYHNGTTILLAAILYSIQIYCDFSGYSLMAIGIARLFGIRLMDNFKRPYFAISINDFWKRWHISLSTWFRDYVYIPLGGSRVSKVRRNTNLIITFVISGFWHGAAWSFIFWGGMHGIFQIIGKTQNIDFYKQKLDDRLRKIIDIMQTFLLVTFAWIFFRVTNITDAFIAIKKIFTEQGMPYIDTSVFFYVLLPFTMLFTTEFLDEFYPDKFIFFNNQHTWIKYLAHITTSLIIILFGVFDGGQFIYFQF